ncbi:hypothetical protein E2C01_018885 [Portunus trituberculatus]|uniref:Uncharacterized protein n=1 Tax=Portunus trituberculatus TaxID=210409 RepID=A0A5B7DVR9_PORTR|nr:hypothetical protein [Portunus trituberculatus]
MDENKRKLPTPSFLHHHFPHSMVRSLFLCSSGPINPSTTPSTQSTRPYFYITPSFQALTVPSTYHSINYTLSSATCPYFYITISLSLG